MKLFFQKLKDELKDATVPICVSKPFRPVFLQLKEIIRICMEKGSFALQSHFNDFHTNPCIFPSFQATVNFFLRGLTI